jgi:tetratricopeptide (TPR) repeat protein
MPTARDLYDRAGEVRELEDNQLEAIRLLEEAKTLFVQEQDFGGQSDTYRALFLNHKHLYLKTGDPSFRQSALDNIQNSLRIAEEHQLGHLVSRGHFGLGEAEMLFDHYDAAAFEYRRALETYAGTNVERGDYRYHLGDAQYRAGDKEKGKANMLHGLREIQDHRSEVDFFQGNVWESGAHLKLAELLREDSPAEAEEHLKKAKAVIDSDSRLVIRARQWADLADQFGARSLET